MQGQPVSILLQLYNIPLHRKPRLPTYDNGDSSLPVMALIVELDLQNGRPFRTIIKTDILGPHSHNLLPSVSTVDPDLKHISTGEEAILVAAGDQLA